jgi:hypothetical protein
MRGQQQLHDPQPRLGPDRRKHVGIPVDLVEVRFCQYAHTISIFAEISIEVKPPINAFPAPSSGNAWIDHANCISQESAAV